VAGRLSPIEEGELAGMFPAGFADLRILHLQSGSGADSLVLASRGARVIGVDLSKPAVRQARANAEAQGLAGRARFIEADLYDARHTLPEPESFDLVYATWGTIGGLTDVAEWARIVAWYLKPGGRLYFADVHPAAWTFESASFDDASADGAQGVLPPTAYQLGDVLTAVLDAGLRLEFFHEHYAVPWRLFGELREQPDGLWGWPDGRVLPLGLSLAASAPASVVQAG
jgi:SAM-dependent methyltransferase